VIAQTAHDLDVIHDCTPKPHYTGQESPTSVGWFKSFPGRIRIPPCAVIYNNEKPAWTRKKCAGADSGD